MTTGKPRVKDGAKYEIATSAVVRPSRNDREHRFRVKHGMTHYLFVVCILVAFRCGAGQPLSGHNCKIREVDLAILVKVGQRIRMLQVSAAW